VTWPDDRRLRAVAYPAAALAGVYALVSAYWTFGGTALLSTVGGGLERLGRSGGAVAVAVGVVTVVLKLAGALLAVALVRSRGSSRLLERAAAAAGAFLVLYGGGLVVVGALALAGLFGTPDDPTALRWHVLVWDLWFLLWGAFLLAAAVRHRRLRRAAAPR
jgi:uncharacterized protein DUF3995